MKDMRAVIEPSILGWMLNLVLLIFQAV